VRFTAALLAELTRWAQATCTDFAPEPITAADVRDWADRLVERADRTLDELARCRSDLREDDRRLTDELLSRRRTLAGRLRELLPESTDTVKIRHHGDFHLGQMLIVKDDVFIIDFEGEPRRSIEDRRRKARQRDVAGLIRSIDYSATAALGARSNPHPMNSSGSPALDGWRDHSVNAFSPPIGNPRRMPGFGRARKRPIACSISSCWRKRSTRSNTNHQPDWLRVPLAGTWRILSRSELPQNELARRRLRRH
jgi:maltose alpha-D-glucosyltransferase/alpha-amylase